ncbi:class I SAM-dependent methyltransferase [Nocardia sp. NBC_00565]|uniref:class I SAM-dependent methyltransferase n=1 Tax=Nocardia sp. NBC_00565 TaxID=2975993 RepID=UPI002E8052B2|nr:class I SAM-dependent methyltransferase [Nocardia sp. NBC_00565]WUC04928.1 class I SAM-dependent methyltransferase [Nocardia sp. NBC_00565]
MNRPSEFWNSVYDDGSAPWVIGEPQPAVLELIEQGWIRGAVLDVGCGAGEHTIRLTELGYDVLGVDLSPSAIAYARANAERRGVAARFEEADALKLGEEPRYRTILDSALFHVFAHDNGDPTDYVSSLHKVLEPGGLVHILALSDAEPGFGPRISRTAISDAFGAGWELEELAPARYRGRVSEAVVEAEQLGLTPGSIVDGAAWLARVRRS